MSQCQAESVTADAASTTVIQLSHAKLPVTMSQSCVRITITAAVEPTGPGTKSRNGTTSWAKWLPSTSPRWNHLGSRCACRLNGFGIGCVSWWYVSAVRSRHSRPPRILIMPAPNSRRNTSHQIATMIVTGGGWSFDPRNATVKSASQSSISQPKP